MTQPNTLRLADSISRIDTLTEHQRSELLQAAAELRRLHAENEALRGANNAFGQRQEWWNERMFVLEQQRDELLSALQAMLTHMGMDEDEWNKPTFDQARAAIAKAEGQQ